MFRFQTQIQNAVGNALDGVFLYVCSQPADTDTNPPSPLIQLYTDSTGTEILPNPAISDGNGNIFFYAPAGFYTLVFYDRYQRIPTMVFPDMPVIGTGSGSVTSVALTMPPEFTVTGSPIIDSGTFAVDKVNQNALTVYAGPVSGPAAAPTFKDLATLIAAAGIGDGTVTSVAITQSLSALLTGSVSGSPITSAGTITLTINFANQNANLFLAGPVSGSSGPVTARRIVPPDFPLLVTVTWSNSPVFDASLSNSFAITLTGDSNFPTIPNGTAGQEITMIITQDATGNRIFTWPANVYGASPIGSDPNNVTTQKFIWTGSLWRATTSGLVMSS